MRSDITRKQQKRSDYTDAPNIIVRITSVLTRKSSGGGTNSGFFGISQHFRSLPRFSEMISSDQTKSESVFTGRHWLPADASTKYSANLQLLAAQAVRGQGQTRQYLVKIVLLPSRLPNSISALQDLNSSSISLSLVMPPRQSDSNLLRPS